MQSEQINELAAALAKAQGQMKNAVMNRINPHFKSQYADLASVIDAIREPLASNGLAVTQTMGFDAQGLVLETMLLHSSGQWLRSEYPLPTIARPQEMGSALTYARRYSLAALVCNSSDEEDDDAEGAEAKKQVIAAGRKPKPPAPNVMLPPKAPPHEVAAKPAPVSSPQPTEAGAGEVSLEDQARDIAAEGEPSFIAWYKELTPAEKKRLSSIGEELRNLMLQSDNAGTA